MYAWLAIAVHAAISSAAALAVAPRSVAVGATLKSLWVLGLASAVLSNIGLVATSMYLSRRLKPGSGLTVGWLCGLLCAAMLALSLGAGIDYSLVTYLALLAPTLLAITLASVLDRPKSGWQT